METTVRPQIYVHISTNISNEVVQPILNGLEEEGIPFLLEQFSTNELVSEAYKACLQSSLNVGIACNEHQAVMHYKNLKAAEPYLVIDRLQTQPKELLKHFGGNAARLVKGIPFKDMR